MADSIFYTLAQEPLIVECKRLCTFTDELDQKPTEIKERIELEAPIGDLQFAQNHTNEAWQKRKEVRE